MEKSQQESLPSSAPRFDSRDLARKIAEINGGESKTVTVEMIGKKDVQEWIEGLNALRSSPPSCKLRSKTRGDILLALS